MPFTFEGGKMTRIYLIRHGQTTGNAKGVVQGSIDLDLNDIGRGQAEKLAWRFADIPVDKIYSSPLIRARNTAQAIADIAGISVEMVPDIAEIGFGDKWEGKSMEYIRENYPVEAQRLHDAPHLHELDGGESMKTVYDRMHRAIDRIAAENDGKTVVIVTHGCALQNYLCYAKKMPFERLKDIKLLENTSVTYVEYEGSDIHLVYENDYTHIKELIDDTATT